MPWEVDVKESVTGASSRCEISVLKSDYALGRESWGWFHPLKKISVVKQHLCALNPTAQIGRQEALEIAQTICDALNEREVRNNTKEETSEEGGLTAMKGPEVSADACSE